MVLEFIRFSATKGGAQVALSNVDLMESYQISPKTAKAKLLSTADALEMGGYTLVWECRPFTETEIDEWLDVIRAGIWMEEQQIHAEFG